LCSMTPSIPVQARSDIFTFTPHFLAPEHIQYVQGIVFISVTGVIIQSSLAPICAYNMRLHIKTSCIYLYYCITAIKYPILYHRGFSSMGILYHTGDGTEYTCIHTIYHMAITTGIYGMVSSPSPVWSFEVLELTVGLSPCLWGQETGLDWTFKH
jgi:hypothetical protein